jgi:lipid-binding SYLF domain-containing protein
LAIFPSVYKAGFVIGGSYGKGIFVVRDPKTKKWRGPTFMTLGGGSLGWQIGVEAKDLVLVIMNERGVKAFLHDNVGLGGDVSVAAGPVGRSLEAGTDITIKTEIYSYSRSKGFFAGISLKGSYLRQDIDANQVFYGKPYTITEIISGNVPVPQQGKLLLDQLNNIIPTEKKVQKNSASNEGVLYNTNEKP